MSFEALQWAMTSEDGRVLQASGSELVNMYVEPVVSKYGRVPTVLHFTPGLQERFHFQTGLLRGSSNSEAFLSGETPVNGLISIDTPTYGERLYGIVGGRWFFRYGDTDSLRIPTHYGRFYADESISTPQIGGGTRLIEEIHVGTTEEDEFINGPARMATDGKNVLMLFGGDNIKRFDIARNRFTTIEAPTPQDSSDTLPDEDFVDVLWSDGYFILVARNGQIFHSILRATQFDQLDFARAEVNPDEIVGAAVFNRRLAIFGSNSIEYYANVGAADFAYSRDTSLSPEIGCLSRDTIQKNDLSIFFLGSNGIVYATVGGNPVQISNFSIEYDIARADSSQARAFTYTEEGHRFYSLTLPDIEVTWVFDATTNIWHERDMHHILSHAKYQGQNLVGTTSDGSQFGDGTGVVGTVAELTLNTSIDWTHTVPKRIQRTAIAPILFLNEIAIRISSLIVEVEITFFGDDRDVVDYATDTFDLSWSIDGKNTWRPMVGDTLAPLMHRISRNTHRVRYNCLGQFTRAHFRLQMNTGYFITINGVYAETSGRRDPGAIPGTIPNTVT